MADSIYVSIDVDASDAFKELEKMRLRTTDFSPVFEVARKDLEKANAENFSTGGLPVGGWTPRRSDYGWPILQRTGDLRDSLTNLVGPSAEFRRLGVTAETARFGTNVEYAKFHQSGTRRMPARQVVFEPAGFEMDLADAASDYVARGKLFR